MDKVTIESKEDIISKMRKLLNEKESSDVKQKEIRQRDFIDNIKVSKNDMDMEFLRKQFLKEIDENDEILNRLSLDRLKKLEEYYDNLILQNDKRINELKAKIKKS